MTEQAKHVGAFCLAYVVDSKEANDFLASRYLFESMERRQKHYRSKTCKTDSGSFNT